MSNPPPEQIDIDSILSHLLPEQLVVFDRMITSYETHQRIKNLQDQIKANPSLLLPIITELSKTHTEEYMSNVFNLLLSSFERPRIAGNLVNDKGTGHVKNK